MSFNEESFFSQESRDICLNELKKHKEAIDFAHEANKIANRMKYEFHIPDNQRKLIIIGALFIKALQSYNSIIILIKHGLASDAMGHTRILIENCMKLCAIINNEEYYENYIDSDKYDYYKTVKMIKDHEQFFGKSVVEEYSKIDIIELEKSCKKPTYYSSEKVAKIANMESLYYNAYKYQCSDVHSDTKGASQFLSIDEKESKFEFAIFPTFKFFDVNIYMAIMSLVTVLVALNDLFNLKYKDEIEHFSERVNNHFI